MIKSEKNGVVDPSIKLAYQKANSKLRFRYSKIGCFLALFLIPTGSLLDHFVYQFFIDSFFKIRILAVISIACILLIHYTKPGKLYIRLLDISWMLVSTASTGIIIALSEGPNSPYYAGLNLVILAAAVLLPWTLKETLFLCVATLIIYLSACLFHTYRTGLLTNWNILFNNTYFILLTAIICCTSSYFVSRARFRDFVLRHELDIRNKKLEELDRLKSQFFANVSHELRTPLTLILSPIENLLHKERNLSGKIRKELLLAHKNTLRLLKLVNELLDTIQIDAGKLKLSKKPIDLAGFTSGIVESVRYLAKEKNLSLKTESPPEPLIVEGDPEHLEKVFLNLLSNAIKFTPSGGNITIRFERTEAKAIVEVEDTGEGIGPEELTHIFDRFYQVDGSSTRKLQGIGIGLALTRDLIEQHDGTVTARSELGHGTTFKVELPRFVSTKQEFVVSPPDKLTKTSSPLGLKSADRTLIQNVQKSTKSLPVMGSGDTTILVVDDEPDMLRFIAGNMADHYRVLSAVNGEQAITVARSEKPSVIILDWMLPGMDGLQVCEVLRGDEATRDIKILLLTARVDEESKIRALQRGADDFLNKPFSFVEVKTRLANLLRTARLQRDLQERNTHLENTLKQLRETESQLVQSEKMRALGSLSAGLLHEINNPLNFTLTALQVCRDSTSKEDERLQDTLNDIEEGMQRVREITSDLHTFAYPQTVDMRATFELNSALDSALRLITHEVDGITITQKIEQSPRLLGSQTQIVHLLINLIMNSVKALKEVPKNASPTIKISGQRHRDRFKISVQDNGIGMKPETLDRVFDPFFTTRDLGDGMGLGLSICHTIVKNHGGDITVKSKEGKWTKFSFDLPLELKADQN